tara:strand:+ start:6822 stop:7664 length:843 start_codon:yes stop_codon:yes gene_type:complete
MSKIIIIADFFVNEIMGGGEINNDELIKILRKKKYEVDEIKSINVTPRYLKELPLDTKIIVSNFIQLSKESKQIIQNEKSYLIYEHDHKYVKTRNPADYKNFLAPKEHIINYNFYKNAKSVLCQSTFHSDIVKSNLHFDNILSLSGNLWSPSSLELMEKICKIDKGQKYSIINSNTWHKNTKGTVYLCETKKWEYDLINPGSYSKFLSDLGKNDKFIFLPKTPETLSRIVVEARMMGMSVITNNLVGATKEAWFSQKGPELIETVLKMRKSIPEKVLQSF